MIAGEFDKNASLLLKEILTDLVGKAWCKETASPACTEAWMEGNASGQGDVTALLVQDIFGGVLLRGHIEGYGFHYWNRIPIETPNEWVDGPEMEVDLVRHQFPRGTDVSPGVPTSRERVLYSEPAVKARTAPRYELLRLRCARLLMAAGTELIKNS